MIAGRLSRERLNDRKIISQRSRSPCRSVHAFAAVDVNTANDDALRGIKGIGPAKAKAILDERDAHGPFKDAAELEQAREGHGRQTVERLQAEGLPSGRPARRPRRRTRGRARPTASAAAQPVIGEEIGGVRRMLPTRRSADAPPFIVDHWIDLAHRRPHELRVQPQSLKPIGAAGSQRNRWATIGAFPASRQNSAIRLHARSPEQSAQTYRYGLHDNRRHDRQYAARAARPSRRTTTFAAATTWFSASWKATIRRAR